MRWRRRENVSLFKACPFLTLISRFGNHLSGKINPGVLSEGELIVQNVWAKERNRWRTRRGRETAVGGKKGGDEWVLGVDVLVDGFN
jgi:hypothetical protein